MYFSQSLVNIHTDLEVNHFYWILELDWCASGQSVNYIITKTPQRGVKNGQNLKRNHVNASKMTISLQSSLIQAVRSDFKPKFKEKFKIHCNQWITFQIKDDMFALLHFFIACI